jgi:hypothetical protein
MPQCGTVANMHSMDWIPEIRLTLQYRPAHGGAKLDDDAWNPQIIKLTLYKSWKMRARYSV